jgi:hypothetical protein
MEDGVMKEKTILVIFLYAITSLAALVLVPTLAYTVFDFVGFVVGLVLVLAAILMQEDNCSSKKIM